MAARRMARAARARRGWTAGRARRRNSGATARRVAGAVVGFLAASFWLTAEPAASQISALQPGDVFSHCELRCPEMLILPGGAFEMGSSVDETGRDSDEGPVRTVTIEPFAIALTETTYAQWDLCVADGYCRPINQDLGFGKGRGRRPVIGVSWRDVVGAQRWTDDEEPIPLPPLDGFLAWMNAKVDGWPYRLPTEAEWEYAARGGSLRAYHTGRSITAEDANFNPRPRVGEPVDGPYRGMTVAVGTLPPNGFGLFEMAGNAWEWVQDCYRRNYELAPVDGSAVLDPDCKERVLRGGSYLNFPIGVRPANRYHFEAERSLGSFGFRVVYDLQATAFE